MSAILQTSMPRSSICPRLRPVESIVVPHPSFGRALVLRDSEGIAGGALELSMNLVPIIARFDGVSSLEVVAQRASRASGRPVDVELVEALVAKLDEAYLLDTPRFRAKRREAMDVFAAAPERSAHHAGGAYHGEPAALARFIEKECLGQAPATEAARAGRMVGLCAPHMDLWRAAVGYGHAYRALGEALPPEADTFFLLGTSHAPMQRPFAVCDKRFATPLGAMERDQEAIAFLANRSRFDVREDEYLHKGEHSLEFQVVFLRHLLGSRPVKIVPILCGLGEAQSKKTDPARDDAAESFLEALGELVERYGLRAFVVAGADLAHVGPRFGDRQPLDAPGRAKLELRDADSLRLAMARDVGGFYGHVAADLETRRVCGLGPIYTMLRALPGAARGELLHYAQCVDPEEGSLVSHASVGFYE